MSSKTITYGSINTKTNKMESVDSYIGYRDLNFLPRECMEEEKNVDDPYFEIRKPNFGSKLIKVCKIADWQ